MQRRALTPVPQVTERQVRWRTRCADVGSWTVSTCQSNSSITKFTAAHRENTGRRCRYIVVVRLAIVSARSSRVAAVLDAGVGAGHADRGIAPGQGFDFPLKPGYS